MENKLTGLNKRKHSLLYLFAGTAILLLPSIWVIALNIAIYNEITRFNSPVVPILLITITIILYFLTLSLYIICAKNERQKRYIESTSSIIGGTITSFFGSIALSNSGFITAHDVYEINKSLFFIGYLVFMSGRSLFTYGCSILAINKGRHYQLGWLGGIAGLFGLFILWLIPNKLLNNQSEDNRFGQFDPIPNADTEEQAMKICPKCNTKYEYYASFCNNCDIDLTNSK